MIFFWLLIGGEGRVGKGCERHVGYDVIIGGVAVSCAK